MGYKKLIILICTLLVTTILVEKPFGAEFLKFGAISGHEDSCECTTKQTPVCASNSLTYSNNCTLACVRRRQPSLRAVCNGPCPCSVKVNVTSPAGNVKFPTGSQVIEDEELCACPRAEIWSPVCGSDGETYPNMCEFKCAKRSDPTLICLCNGECPCREFPDEPCEDQRT